MLDYASGKPQYQPTAEDRDWLIRRLGYYALHLMVLLAIAFTIGPNLFLFHSPFSPSPAAFVPFTAPYVSMIAEIKAYNRDTGQLPMDTMSLPPQYMPANYNGDVGEINLTTSITFQVSYGAVLEYEFSAAKEGWYVHSPRYDGPIPAPIIAAAPIPAQPATTPAAQVTVQPTMTAPHGK